ncbi:MAG: hypothetical protein GWP91_23605 [Rhodobacterales bacterium]|nr:hypothetical protein [Rhodobacterales bacterium]
MSEHDDFAAGLADAQDAILHGDDSLTLVRESLLNTPTPVPARPWKSVGVMAVPLLAVAAVAVLWLAQPVGAMGVSANGQAYKVGDWISAVDTPVLVSFTDGSEMVLESGAQVRLQGLASQGVVLSLEQGRSHFEVQHATETDWRIHAGPFEVYVTGTVFDAGWQPDTEVFTLEMADGSVLVSGPHLGEGRTVEGTEALQVWLTEGRSALTVGGIPQPEAAVVAVVAPVAPEVAPTTTVAPVPLRVRITQVEAQEMMAEPVGVSWQTLVQQGAYADAVALVEQQGVDKALTEGTAADLIALGDAARLSKQYRLSEAAYLAVRDRFPGGVAAANSAFSLGRLAFDQRKQMDQAARWLRVYVAEQPEGVLKRDALGRLMEAEDKLGERAAARQVADDYLAQFPDGPHAAFARVLVKRRRL